VEAADDICYSIVDMEDAHRLGILRESEVSGAFMELVNGIGKEGENPDKIYGYYKQLEDKNEAIAFLRAKVINILANAAVNVFWEHQKEIISGKFNNSLIDLINDRTKALDNIQDISINKIYGHDTVIQIEIAGYNVMSELLSLFIPALLRNKPSHKEAKVLKLIPFQFTEFENTGSSYERVMSALDLLSGMTDEYATEMYRRLKGITIPGHG
jgi:dGTPase